MSDYFDDAEDAKLLAVEQEDDWVFEMTTATGRRTHRASGKELRDLLLTDREEMLNEMWGGGHD